MAQSQHQHGYSFRERNKSSRIPVPTTPTSPRQKLGVFVPGTQSSPTQSTLELQLEQDSLQQGMRPELNGDQVGNVIPEKRKIVPKQVIEIPVVKMADFEVVDIEDKLNLLMSAINKVNTNFHIKLEQIQLEMQKDRTSTNSKISALENLCQEMQARLDDNEVAASDIAGLTDRIAELEETNANMMDDISILKGLAQVHDKAITVNKSKIIDLTARSMANNILVQGLTGDSGEETMAACKQKVLEFLRVKMNMEIEDAEVEVAHRLGSRLKNAVRPRQMVVRCKHDLRSRIFNYSKNLKDVQNEDGDYYQVNAQLPEPLLTQKKRKR